MGHTRDECFAWPATWMATSKGLSPTVKRNLLKPYQNWQNRIGIARFVQDIPRNHTHPSYQTLSILKKT